jgi:transposase
VREELSFVDEFGLTLTLTRTHARAPLGERAHVTEPFHHGSTRSVISALGVHGVCAPLRMEGAVNSEGFEVSVKPLLVPCLRPGHLVLLDNLKFHSSPRAMEWIGAAGARVVHLPAYSPAFNPLEGCLSKLKTALRSFKARTKRTLTNALAKALTLITKEDIHGWFEHAGYVFSLN